MADQGEFFGDAKRLKRRGMNPLTVKAAIKTHSKEEKLRGAAEEPRT